MKKLIIYIPFLMLMGDGISFLAYQKNWYNEYIYLHSEVFGHSILPVIFMMYFANRLKYCAFSLVAIYSLLLLNILNITYFFVNLSYYEFYAGFIIFVGLIFAVILWVKQVY